MLYRCSDDSNTRIDIEANSSEDAAQEYVDGGDWGEGDAPVFIRVVTDEILGYDEDGDEIFGEHESHTIILDAIEPDCDGEEEHDWQSPLSIVGGCPDNPGVFANTQGPGVMIFEVCMVCGCARITNTGAQNPCDGTQGHHVTSYDPGRWADEVAELRDSDE